MSQPRTLPMYHFIILDGFEDNFKWRGISDGVQHEVQPFRLMSGFEWCVPMAVTSIPGLPEDFKQSLFDLNHTRQLTCCDFKACNHEES